MKGSEQLYSARLYVITPDRAAEEVVALGRAAVRGGADVLQMRHKTLARGELLELARRLREVTTEAGVLLIVNDHADIALIAGADGVHLGPDDVSVESARAVAPAGFLIGASASSPAAAGAAVRAGADYLGSGPAFATPVKKEKGVIGPAGVAAVAAAVKVPVFAIGGIEESNVAQLAALGLRRVCVIRAIAEASDPESATRRLRAMLDA
ncbi:MAG TPA: thiamine phosphate synthase [Candidatus Dormibacteraeota bacterium]|nr:thiamine phosphate synthase [Candidatus Dormibacteraeota bacterium]